MRAREVTIEQLFSSKVAYVSPSFQRPYSWIRGACVRVLSGITKDYNMTTIINTHDMNSVMGIGENIIFIYKGHKEWQGTKDDVMGATNKKLNDLVFASDLFRKVKKAELADEEERERQEHKKQ